MTDLEQVLASILKSIENARTVGDPLVLATLLQRKDVICAVLAAPEQSWLAPQAQAPMNVRRQCESDKKVLVPVLANSCV